MELRGWTASSSVRAMKTGGVSGVTCFSGESKRQRNCASGWFFAPMVRYLRTFAPGGTIKDQVTAWAKTQHSPDVAPLSDEEIEALRKYLIAND